MPKRTQELERAIIPLTNVARAEEFIGSLASVEGEAVDRDRSAAVTREDLVVYLVDIEKWPDDVRGKTVTVRGDLGRTEEDDGAVFVFHDVRYEVEGEGDASGDDD